LNEAFAVQAIALYEGGKKGKGEKKGGKGGRREGKPNQENRLHPHRCEGPITSFHLGKQGKKKKREEGGGKGGKGEREGRIFRVGCG